MYTSFWQGYDEVTRKLSGLAHFFQQPNFYRYWAKYLCLFLCSLFLHYSATVFTLFVSSSSDKSWNLTLSIFLFLILTFSFSLRLICFSNLSNHSKSSFKFIWLYVQWKWLFYKYRTILFQPMEIFVCIREGDYKIRVITALLFPYKSKLNAMNHIINKRNNMFKNIICYFKRFNSCSDHHLQF